MNFRKFGGAALLIAGGFLGRETLVWAFDRFLDAVSAGVRGGVHFASTSWQNSLSTVLIIIGIALVFWPKARANSVAKEDFGQLQRAAADIVRRVRSHRHASYFTRDRLEPVSDIATAGNSVLISFEKAGFEAPVFNGLYAEQAAIGMEAYFAALIPLMGYGHIEEARESAKSAGDTAVAAAAAFHPQTWFYSGV